ncbi:GIY-YIG nuclease family protein [Streptosporangium canum]|uniref:GIY-YIG nuclease family protein n=1 Tax=Streptosporangium canum TaxID=324952 RepID=UPI0033A7CD6B
MYSALNLRRLGRSARGLCDFGSELTVSSSCAPAPRSAAVKVTIVSSPISPYWQLRRVSPPDVSPEPAKEGIHELELTADYLAKQEEEKERTRAQREQQREEEAARREFEREKTRLRKEEARYRSALSKGDEAGAEKLKAKLEEIGAAVSDVEAREANVRAGYVYVISNVGAFGEDVVKIGMTRRLEPEDRVRELGDASVPFRFDTHALIFSDDAVGLEGRLHTESNDRRVNKVNLRREFFHATPADVRDLLQKIAGQHLLEYRDTPEALEWRQSVHAKTAAG